MTTEEKKIAIEKIIKQQKLILKKCLKIAKLPTSKSYIVCMKRASKVVSYILNAKMLEAEKHTIASQIDRSKLTPGGFVFYDSNEYIIPKTFEVKHMEQPGQIRSITVTSGKTSKKKLNKIINQLKTKCQHTQTE